MEEQQATNEKLDVVGLTTNIVSSYVGGNKMSVAEIPDFIRIHTTLSSVTLGKFESASQNLEPAVPIRTPSSRPISSALRTKKFKSLNDTFAAPSTCRPRNIAGNGA